MNVALNKAAVNHPGTHSQFTATNAVDGNTGPWSSATCSHTTPGSAENPAWWRVDLGEPYRISGIKIYNRERVGKLFGI